MSFTPFHPTYFGLSVACKLTTLPQLNGNKYITWDISRNSKRQVTKILIRVTNIIRRILPTKGSMKSPNFTVPDVHKHAKQAIVVTCKKKTQL